VKYRIYVPPLLFALIAALALSSGCGHRADESIADNPGAGEPGIDWGREVSLDEMIAMAKEGRLVEIQWHVMPNILRARASDGTIYHFRNENKGVDLKNRLIEEGVPIGKEGLQFRHFF
jgi:hypothetical protein